MIRVLVVTDSATARAGLGARLAGDDRLEIAGDALSPGDLERLVSVGSADVVVAAVNPDDERTAGAVLALAAEDTAPPVVVLVDDETGSILSWTGEALQAGVRAVLPLDVGAEELRAAVAAAAAGFVVIRPEDTAAAARPGRLRQALPLPLPVLSPLTPRELEVLGLLAEGLGNKSIAARIAISERTVKFHVGAIFEKLGVTSRTEAVTAALRRGLILL